MLGVARSRYLPAFSLCPAIRPVKRKLNNREVRDRPVTVPDLYRTIAHVLDLNPDKIRTAPSGRPLKSVDAGSVIAGLI